MKPEEALEELVMIVQATGATISGTARTGLVNGRYQMVRVSGMRRRDEEPSI